MIFITLGSQKFQFNRILKKIDELIEKDIIKEEVFAQIGYSDYRPINYKYEDFLDREKFSKLMESSTLVITHGGTGAIITAVKAGKKVIAVPRLAQYGEHVDDHQLQLLKQFDGMGIILPCYDIEELDKKIIEIEKIKLNPYISNTKVILEDIEKYIGK
ncbi:MAG: PssE/Cps14G family polysaccharide biosynthesis glycosyltransferase [Fusobacterium sp.]|uniref:PssE/Cps14G family polysaccharide biosynthesis glycosyltransferase n=1 Tax=Fusobacterium sp. TaxID=68766 RepID=UPI0029422530|nr:PssE/Cps14G family polysaccharide biosynthesis glycosyltransferase [Fusobacterium sp.]MDY3059064.1 PssE/Cps14G family polysaccharide biosynthesis glycosyltransferase [Fusobacterium sp.]